MKNLLKAIISIILVSVFAVTVYAEGNIHNHVYETWDSYEYTWKNSEKHTVDTKKNYRCVYTENGWHCPYTYSQIILTQEENHYTTDNETFTGNHYHDYANNRHYYEYGKTCLSCRHVIPGTTHWVYHICHGNCLLPNSIIEPIYTIN